MPPPLRQPESTRKGLQKVRGQLPTPSCHVFGFVCHCASPGTSWGRQGRLWVRFPWQRRSSACCCSPQRRARCCSPSSSHSPQFAHSPQPVHRQRKLLRTSDPNQHICCFHRRTFLNVQRPSGRERCSVTPLSSR